jgi:hypothetical protein
MTYGICYGAVVASNDSRVRGLQVFEGKGSVKLGAAYVTIQKKGVLGLNAASHELLGKPETVELLFNPEEQVIGIRQADGQAPHTYRILAKSDGSALTISARAFLKFYDVALERSVRYPAELVEGILIIDLRQEGVDAHRRSGEVLT